MAASEKCHQEKRKTVNGEDILFAMTSLGFENYAEALKIYLSKYREVSKHDLEIFANFLVTFSNESELTHFRLNQPGARIDQEAKGLEQRLVRGPEMRPRHSQAAKAQTTF